MLTLLWLAAHKRIASEAGRAAADGVVVHHLAAGVRAAGARAGVRAALVDARPVLGAVGAHHALGPAGGRRADVVELARAHGVAVHLAALAVRTTGRRRARVLGRLDYSESERDGGQRERGRERK